MLLSHTCNALSADLTKQFFTVDVVDQQHDGKLIVKNYLQDLHDKKVAAEQDRSREHW